MPRFLAAVLLAASAALTLTSSAQAADVVVGKRAPAAQRVSYDQIDHTPWDELLREFVNDRGQVDYRGMKASGAAVAKLDAYLNHLSAIDPTKPATRAGELAYWINAYNAVTVKGILREYPTTSIRNHTAKVFGYNIWKNLKLLYADSQINLNDIEHEVLRKRNEPRIHFAIVCASIGCPRLLNEAYVAERLDEQLTTNARDFFATQRNFQVDASRNTVKLSAILDWFGSDFGPNQRAQLQAIAQWAPESARGVLNSGNARVSYLNYDWGINEQ